MNEEMASFDDLCLWCGVMHRIIKRIYAYEFDTIDQICADAKHNYYPIREVRQSIELARLAVSHSPHAREQVTRTEPRDSTQHLRRAFARGVMPATTGPQTESPSA